MEMELEREYIICLDKETFLTRTIIEQNVVFMQTKGHLIRPYFLIETIYCFMIVFYAKNKMK